MSQQYYTKLWHKNQQALKDLLKEDQALTDRPMKKRLEAKRLIGTVYIRYIQISNNFIDCYDQIIHPQKREIIRKVMDLCIARVIQLKEAIVNFEFTQVNYFDDILVQLNLTPNDLQIKIPSYARINRTDEFEAWRKLFDRAEKEMGYTCEDTEAETVKPNVMTMFPTLQTNTQSTEEESETEETEETEEKGEKWKSEPEQQEIRPFEETFSNCDKEAIFIQYHLLKYLQKIEKRIFIGMEVPRWPEIAQAFLDDLEIKQMNRLKQNDRAENYDVDLTKIKGHLKNLHAAQITEDIEDEIRSWIVHFFRRTGCFPTYPSEKLVLVPGLMQGVPKKFPKELREKMFPCEDPPKGELERSLCGYLYLGGSALIVADQYINAEDYMNIMQELKKGGNKATAKKNKQEKKKKKEENFNAPIHLEPSRCFKPLQLLLAEYDIIWKDLSEEDNVDQKHLISTIENDQLYEIGLEVREDTDKFMRSELELLKDAQYRDLHLKRKRRKSRERKQKRKKAKKDPLGSKSIDDWVVELIKTNVIRKPMNIYLENFCGDRCYSSTLGRNSSLCSGELKDLLLQYCILPLTSDIVHQFAPLTRSVCLIGPEGNAKRLLSEMICTETGAVVFDLTVTRMADYVTVKQLKTLLNVILRLATELQPVIIYFDGIEEAFYKKVPQEEKIFNPKKMKGILTIIRKKIKAMDRVLLLATCRRPWLAKKAALRKLFDRFFYVPHPDYGSHALGWKAALQSNGLQKIDFSALAKISHEFKMPIAQIFNIVHDKLRVKSMPNAKDFMEVLLEFKADSRKNEARCLKFLEKTNLGKRRIKYETMVHRYKRK